MRHVRCPSHDDQRGTECPAGGCYGTHHRSSCRRPHRDVVLRIARGARAHCVAAGSKCVGQRTEWRGREGASRGRHLAGAASVALTPELAVLGTTLALWSGVGSERHTIDDDSGLCYLEAGNVKLPAGKLADLQLCSRDDQTLGAVEGVLIEPSARRVPLLRRQTIRMAARRAVSAPSRGHGARRSRAKCPAD